MRYLLWAIVAIAGIWCAWWAIAAYGLTSGVNAWFDAQQRAGAIAQAGEIRSRGFPARVEAHMSDVVLGNAATGEQVELDTLVLSVRTLWPGDIQVQLPQTPVRVQGPAGNLLLVADTARADLNLHPGVALELEQMSVTSGPFRLEETSSQALFGGEALLARMAQEELATEYALTFDITNFTPGARLRDGLQMPDGWPLIFETFEARADVRFDIPLDRTALEPLRQAPQPQAIDLELAEMRWGDMLISASGSVIRDKNGAAEGSIVIRAENWSRMLDIAEAAGLLPREFRPRAEAMLAGLARSTGRTDALDLTLTFGNGLTRIGFIPIGPAPSMIIR